MDKNSLKKTKKKLVLKSSSTFNEFNTFNITSDIQINQIIESIKEVYWQCDNKLHFDFLSPSVQSLTGYSEEELKHKTIFDLVTPKSRVELEKYSQIYNSLEQKGIKRTKRNYIVEFIKKDKNKILLDLSIIPIYDETGSLLRFHGVASDVTPQILYQEQKKELQEQIRSIINIMPFSITLYDLKTQKIIHANESFAKMLRINLNDTFGMEITDYIISGLNKRLLKEIIKNEKIEQEEILMRKSNGEPFWVLISCSLLKFEKENVVLVGFVEINNERVDLYNNQKMFSELTNSINKIADDNISPNKKSLILKSNKDNTTNEKMILDNLSTLNRVVEDLESIKNTNNFELQKILNTSLTDIVDRIKKIILNDKFQKTLLEK